jgi:hypothetical protein
MAAASDAAPARTPLFLDLRQVPGPRPRLGKASPSTVEENR